MTAAGNSGFPLAPNEQSSAQSSHKAVNSSSTGGSKPFLQRVLRISTLKSGPPNIAASDQKQAQKNGTMKGIQIENEGAMDEEEKVNVKERENTIEASGMERLEAKYAGE